jgi:hypothetical protein
MCRLYFISILEREENSAAVQMGYEHYLPIMRELYPNKPDNDLIFLIYPIACAIQMIFLNGAPFKTATGMDFFREEDRHAIIETLVSNGLKSEESA